MRLQLAKPAFLSAISDPDILVGPLAADQSQSDGRLSAAAITTDGNGDLVRVVYHIGCARRCWWRRKRSEGEDKAVVVVVFQTRAGVGSFVNGLRDVGDGPDYVVLPTGMVERGDRQRERERVVVSGG